MGESSVGKANDPGQTLRKSSGETCMEACNPKQFSKGGGGHMVGMEINFEARRNLDAGPQ
jgi:hypothetical protein